MDKPKTKSVLPILFGTLLLDTISFGIVIPIIPSLFTDSTAEGFILGSFTTSEQLFLAGAITAVFGLMQFIAAPILGELSDVFGRKKLLTLGVGVLAFSQLLFGLGIAISSLGLLFFARIIAGLAAANISIAQATIADVSAPQDRAKNFGLIGAAFGLGFIIGPLLSGWLSALTGDPATPFWVATVLGLINVLFVTLFLTETNTDRDERQKFTLLKGFKNIRTAFADVDTRPLYSTTFLYFSGFTFYVSYIGVLLVNQYDFTEATVGTFFGVIGIFIFITQAIILRYISGKFTERAIIKVTILATAAAIAVYPFAPNVIFLYVLIPFLAVPQGLTMANLPALISKGVSGKKQGAALGINSSIMALAQGVVPLIGGVIAAFVSIKFVFIVGGLSVVASWLVLFKFSKRT